MKVFVPHGVTCFSGTSFSCISQFENWQAVLLEASKRAYPGRNPDTIIFHRVHSAIDEVSSLHDPVTKHFILADSEEQECTRTVAFAVFTAYYEFFGACHWTQVTQVWDIFDLCGGEKGWVIYHNNQRLRHHKVSVHHGLMRVAQWASQGDRSGTCLLMKGRLEDYAKDMDLSFFRRSLQTIALQCRLPQLI